MRVLNEEEEQNKRIMRLGIKTVLNFHITYTLGDITLLVSRKSKKLIKKIVNKEILNGNVSKNNFSSRDYWRVK